MISEKQQNHDILEEELTWFREIVSRRLDEPTGKIPFDVIPSKIVRELIGSTHYEKVVHRLKLDKKDRVLLLLALARALDDESLFNLKDILSLKLNFENGEDANNMDDVIWAKRLAGGHLHQETQTFIPTLKTLLFLLCGSNRIAQQEALLHFHTRHPLFLEGIIEMHPLGSVQQGDRVVQDWINHQIFLNPSYLRYFLGGPVPQPEDDLRLPIRVLDSGLSLDDLILPDKVYSQLQPAMHFVQAGQAFFQEEGIRNKFREGFVMLLYGPPGTGKTLTASALGNSLGIKTYQLEIAQVVSKYIGETSQNMEKVFAELERAIQWLEGQMCILFIDEADAVMGKRSKVKDSKDRYANMDVSFLLQRLEKFPGLLILATNYERNMDEAFGRRIQTYLHIPLPNEDQRVQLWRNILPKNFGYSSPNLPGILAQHFALTGGHIQNILKQACLHAASDETKELEFNRHLEPYIKSEYMKKNQTYHAPRNILALLQLSPQEYTQYRHWTDALPDKMSFMPGRLPEYLAKTFKLAKSEVANLMKNVLPAQEAAQKGAVNFGHISKSLQNICEKDSNLDWEQLTQQMNAFLGNIAPAKEEAAINKTEETAKPEQKTSQQIEEEKKKAARKAKLAQETAKAFEESAQPSQPKQVPKPVIPPLDNVSQPIGQNQPVPGNGIYNADNQYTPPPAPSQYELDGNRVILNMELATNGWLRFLPEGFVYGRQEMPKNLGKFYALTEHEIKVTLQMAANLAEEEGTQRIKFSPHISEPLEILKKKLEKGSLYRDQFSSM
ncbi:hypothetical protein BKI52_21530 [marine bacterium AO1-C]|nr:hypothetical protein BKI52_21530 [marine bacterium AO1-C]